MNFFFKIIFLFYLLTNLTLANEQLNFRYIDINFILNNSEAGKKILKKLENNNLKKIEDFKTQEKKLSSNKNEILSQKNIISIEEYEKKVLKHQENLAIYQNNRNKHFEEMNNKKNNSMNLLLQKIDQILIDYSKNNSIDMIFKKENLIISNSKYDITNEILEILNKKFKEIN